MATTNARGANTIKIRTNQGGGLLRVVLIGSVGIVSAILLINLIRRNRKVSSGNRLASDPNVQLATQFNSAIHPSRTWIGDIVTSADKETIFKLAYQIKSYDDISREYYNLYEESLTEELQDALGNDYPDFLRILKGGAVSEAELTQIAKELYNEYADISWFHFGTISNEPIQRLNRLSKTEQDRVYAIYKQVYNRNLADDLRKLYEKIF